MIKKRFILIIALIALIACITMPVSAWDATVYGDLYSGSGTLYTTTYGMGYSDYTEVDRLCAQYYPTKPYGTAAGFFAIKNPIGGSVPPFNFEDLQNIDTHYIYPANESGKPWDFNASSQLQGVDPFGATWAGYYYETIYCSATTRTTNPYATGYYWQVYHLNLGSPPVVAPVASFSCTPTSQYPDTSVVCTDTSTNTPTSWLWSIDMEGAGIEGWQTHTGQNFTWESHYPGLYSVNLWANNSAGSDWENKTNYVSISANATPNNCDIEPNAGYIRTYAQTNDGMTSGGIYNSNIQMNDVEGGAWSNVTNSGGWWCIDTLPLHSLNIYAQATGYTPAESIGVPANGGRYYLVLWPDYIPTPSAGNVTLYALVYDQQTGAPLYLSSVRVDGNGINTVLKNTGPEGQAMFTIKNDTSIHVTASKSGYSTITKVVTTSHFGPDTVMISLPRSSITGTPTATSTPSWMTTAPTVGPGPEGTMPAGYTNTQGQIMMDFLATNGMSLVQLCFFVTILALLGVKLGK